MLRWETTMGEELLRILGLALIIFVAGLFARAIGEKAAEWYDRKNQQS